MSQPNVFGYPEMKHLKSDSVNRPAHYNRNGIEAIDAIFEGNKHNMNDYEATDEDYD